MNTYTTATFIVALIVVGFSTFARADYVSYRDAVKACGMEWKAKAEKPVKGEGRSEWNKFRAECVVRQGYVKGLKAPKSEVIEPSLEGKA
jgi:hypothetical protein